MNGHLLLRIFAECGLWLLKQAFDTNIMQPILLDVPNTLYTERLIIRCPRAGDGQKVFDATIDSLDALREFPASLPWQLMRRRYTHQKLFPAMDSPTSLPGATSLSSCFFATPKQWSAAGGFIDLCGQSQLSISDGGAAHRISVKA